MDRVDALVPYLREIVDKHPDVLERLRDSGHAARCWYAWPPSIVEWAWVELNQSKFNATCGDWHRRNAYVIPPSCAYERVDIPHLTVEFFVFDITIYEDIYIYVCLYIYFFFLYM